MRFVLFIAIVFNSCSIYAGNKLTVYEVDPFYNFSIKFPKGKMQYLDGVINPIKLDLSYFNGAKKLASSEGVSSRSFRGEGVYKSLVLENHGPDRLLKVDFEYDEKSIIFDRSNIELYLVTSWFQAGKYTTRSKKNKFLTQELLLKDDVDIELTDSWTLKDGKWYYIPPSISNADYLTTLIPEGDVRRLLVKIAVPESAKPGAYESNIRVTDINSGQLLQKIPVRLIVANATLDKSLTDQYDIFIYTYLSLDPEIGKKGTYINSQNNIGDYDYQKSMFNKHIENIAGHGFNGVIILDWRDPYINDAFSILKDNNISKVAIYSQSPSKNKKDIVSLNTLKAFKRFGFEPIFYGYDEPGGNIKLKDQILLNKKINQLGAKSFNACFWDDRPDVFNESSQEGSGFSYLNYSLGSHGQDDLFDLLPLEAKEPDIKQLSYWHPHVENPVRNKLFMGYWLWASGLDGVSPHGYYYLPHISHYLKANNASRSELPSPYNDFSMWDQADGIFRHHVSVYPERDGYISTLQWEALADGATDLVLVLQLEQYVNSTSLSKEQSGRGRSLLSKIKNGVKIRDSSAISDRDTARFASEMKAWKQEIKEILLN